MDFFVLVPFVVVFVVGYSVGKMRGSAPTEDEMFQRLVLLRRTRRLEKQVENALDDELSREATK